MFLFDVTSLWRIPVRVFRRIVPIAPTTGHLYCIRRSAPIVHTHTHIFNSRRRENDVSSSTGEMAIWEKQVLRSAGATAWSWTAHGGFRRYAYIYTTNNKMPAQKIDLGYQSRKTWWRPKVAEGPSLGKKKFRRRSDSSCIIHQVRPCALTHLRRLLNVVLMSCCRDCINKRWESSTVHVRGYYIFLFSQKKKKRRVMERIIRAGDLYL